MCNRFAEPVDDGAPAAASPRPRAALPLVAAAVLLAVALVVRVVG